MGARERTSRVGQAFVFDGDDTLWITEPLYDAARERARAVVSDAGLDGAAWEEAQRRIDLENVARLGYSAERFPTSCVQAYEEICNQSGRDPVQSVSESVREAARSVFESDPELFPGVREVLTLLRTRGAQLALLTKGDDAVQRRRIDRSGLEPCFDVVRIVKEKSPETIRGVVQELGASPDRTWMVGNSVRSDVLPALEAGIHAIWVDAHVWEHERSHDHLVDDRVIVISDIGEVANVAA